MLTTAALVKAEGNFPDVIPDTKFDPYIENASVDIRRILSDYDDLDAELGGNDPGQKAKDAQKAETFYALAYAIVPLSTRPAEDGGLVDSVGYGESKTGMMSIGEAMRLADYYRAQGAAILQPYTTDEPDENTGEIDYVTGADFSIFII